MQLGHRKLSPSQQYFMKLIYLLFSVLDIYRIIAATQSAAYDEDTGRVKRGSDRRRRRHPCRQKLLGAVIELG